MDDPQFIMNSEGNAPTCPGDGAEWGLPPEVLEEQKAVQLSAGDLLAERFSVIEQLGFGGMGAVYKVEDTTLEETRALKVMLPSLLLSEGAKARFLAEVKVSQRLSHDLIVRVHDLVEDRQRGIRFFTMEFVEGNTLHRLLTDAGGNLPLDQAVDLMRQLCQAMAYAHQYTIHRDLKPQNIMVATNGRLKVLDFGLAKIMSPGRMTQSSMALGTAYYQAPEQSVHLRESDHRADIYSLGVIFYQLLTGRIPLGRVKAPSELVQDLPPALDDVVFGAIEPEPDDRYAAVENMLTAIDKALDSPAIVEDSGVWDPETEELVLQIRHDFEKMKHTAKTRGNSTPFHKSVGPSRVSVWRRAAELGIPEGQYLLGDAYWEANGVEEDLAQAAKWWAAAVESGLEHAIRDLGRCYWTGNGLPQDRERGLALLRKASDLGDYRAVGDLAVIYIRGDGVPEDKPRAIQMMREIAADGYAGAEHWLGSIYSNGNGVPRDDAEAAMWYRSAAEKGFVLAQETLGSLYFHGRGVPKDPAESFRWSLKAAEQGRAFSQYMVGYAYYNGIGRAPDREEGIRWYKKAAEQGFDKAIEALRNLGLDTPSGG